MRRDPKRIEKVFTAIETGDVTEASRLSRGSRDPVLRMMWNGLNHTGRRADDDDGGVRADRPRRQDRSLV